ncbi:M23 family metallopeptidase [Bacillus sp. V3B]|uniref:M23 family metallopeptidase n=1 Tax=Bacillus sp. V3B TaxID=2804915 RepID=UPI0021092238|nr:M23 family metallopeptidase [Bacillus sp. V3B]MCQ6274638.1 M23 family metallopeptidase [Bacillus sp. V3B]
MREEEKQPSRGSKLKRFFKKRWVFPAVYIASAALILTAVLWYQNSSTDNAIDSDEFDYSAIDVPGDDFKEPAVEVNRSMESVVLPLNGKDRDNAVIQKKFYDDNAKAEEQEAALVVYKNQYHPNTGIDITVEESDAFDVVAALSGTVIKVQEDSLLGNVIEIEHEDNVITHYSSIKDMKVEIGDEIEQGQALATAGQSQFNEGAGTHVHFEIRKNGVPVNPESYLDKPLSDIEAEGTETTEAADSKEESADNGVSEEEATEEEDSMKEDTDSTEEESTEEETPADDSKDKETNNTENQDA